MLVTLRRSIGYRAGSPHILATKTGADDLWSVSVHRSAAAEIPL